MKNIKLYSVEFIDNQERFAIVHTKSTYGNLYFNVNFRLIDGDRTECILTLLDINKMQGKLQAKTTIEHLPYSVFSIDWNNKFVVLFSFNSIFLISDTQVFVLTTNPYGKSELRDKHKVTKDLHLNLSLAGSNHCFIPNKNQLLIFTNSRSL